MARLPRKDAERRRIGAKALLDRGWAQAEVAEKRGVSATAVWKWVQAIERGGADGLKSKPRPGRPPKLTDRQLERLEGLLVRGPTKLGYATELWTLKRVAEVIEKHFGEQYNASGVWYLLKRLGWSCQKPERRARERDEDAIVHWRKKDWPRIKKSASRRLYHRFCR